VLLAKQRVAQTEANVLLLGESGTGKELFARGASPLASP
jgi:transcriptional regulator with PAS, ATPase and Fis domain